MTERLGRGLVVASTVGALALAEIRVSASPSRSAEFTTSQIYDKKDGRKSVVIYDAVPRK